MRHFDSHSTRGKVNSGVPRGSVLEPLLFLVAIKYLPWVARSPCLISTNDPKLWQISREPEKEQQFGADLGALELGSEK